MKLNEFYNPEHDRSVTRDFDDTTRDINPLIKADNAIVVDNTNLNFVEQNNLIFNIFFSIRFSFII